MTTARDLAAHAARTGEAARYYEVFQGGVLVPGVLFAALLISSDPRHTTEGWPLFIAAALACVIATYLAARSARRFREAAGIADADDRIGRLAIASSVVLALAMVVGERFSPSQSFSAAGVAIALVTLVIAGRTRLLRVPLIVAAVVLGVLSVLPLGTWLGRPDGAHPMAQIPTVLGVVCVLEALVMWWASGIIRREVTRHAS